MHSALVILVATVCAVCAQRPYQVPQSSGQIVRILSQTNDIGIDGSYRWSFEAENGIAAEESAQQKNANAQDSIKDAQGSYKYTAPDGTPIQLQYIANEGGFQPTGNHLPVAPPIPPEILKALEWNAAHPEEDNGVAPPGGGFRG